MSSDGVGADGVLITQILAGGALVVLCREREGAVQKSAVCVENNWQMHVYFIPPFEPTHAN